MATPEPGAEGAGDQPELGRAGPMRNPYKRTHFRRAMYVRNALLVVAGLVLVVAGNPIAGVILALAGAALTTLTVVMSRR